MRQQPTMAFVALQDFLWKLIRRGFGELGFTDAAIINYVSEMMTRFARTENLYRIKHIEHTKFETVVEMLWEIIRASGMGERQDDLYRKLFIRQHIGDYTLFMTGVFREYVARLGILDYYLTEGRLSYRAVWEYARRLNEPNCGLFRALAERLEFLSNALDYTKKVHFRAQMQQGPHQDVLRDLSVW